jgi:hypothetical protein
VQELIPGPEANGVNPLIAYRHVVNGVTRSHSPGSGASTGSTSSRTSGPVLKRWRHGELSLRDAMTPYVRRHMFVSFAAADPVPLPRPHRDGPGRPSSPVRRAEDRADGGQDQKLPCSAGARHPRERVGLTVVVIRTSPAARRLYGWSRCVRPKHPPGTRRPVPPEAARSGQPRSRRWTGAIGGRSSTNPGGSTRLRQGVGTR